MKNNKSKTTHENFHKFTQVQKKIISDNNFTYRNIINALKIKLPKDGVILDIGCGAGTMSFYLANKGHKVLGIDLSEKAINICKKTAKELDLDKILEFQQMNFPKECPKGQFTNIIFTEVLEHLADDEMALKKIFSLLKKNGIVLITTPSKNAPLYKLGLAKDFDRRVGHLRRYTKEDLIKKCQDAGFEIIYSEKKEGLLRNFLFLNPVAGNFIRVINKFNLSDIVTFLDDISLKLFGESDIFVIARKP